MNDTLTMTRQPGRLRRSEATAAAVAAILFALLALLASPLLTSSPTVPQLDVDNRTPWPLTVSIRSTDGGGWIPVGVASASSGTSFPEAPDPGDRWQVRFAYAGIDVATTVTRSEVEQNGLTVSVPQELIDALEDAGTPDAPPRGT